MSVPLSLSLYKHCPSLPPNKDSKDAACICLWQVPVLSLNDFPAPLDHLCVAKLLIVSSSRVAGCFKIQDTLCTAASLEVFLCVPLAMAFLLPFVPTLTLVTDLLLTLFVMLSGSLKLNSKVSNTLLHFCFCFFSGRPEMFWVGQAKKNGKEAIPLFF